MFIADSPKNMPKQGEERTTYKFAWKAVKVEGGTVWLERYAIVQRWFSPAGGGPGWWTEGRKLRCEVSYG